MFYTGGDIYCHVRTNYLSKPDEFHFVLIKDSPSNDLKNNAISKSGGIATCHTTHTIVVQIISPEGMSTYLSKIIVSHMSLTTGLATIKRSKVECFKKL